MAIAATTTVAMAAAAAAIRRSGRSGLEGPLRGAIGVSKKYAVRVALATLADERGAAAYSGMTGVIDALRGGTYVVGLDRVGFVGARVVTDAAASGTLEIGRRSTRARVRLRGRGVPRSRLALRTMRRTTRITGTVGRRHVHVHVTT